MTFLTILIALFFYRNWRGSNPVQDYVSFDGFFSFVERSVPRSDVKFLIAIGVPTLGLFILASLSSHWIQGLVWLLISLATLIYCFEIEDTEAEFNEQLARLEAVTEADDLADVVQMQEDFQGDHLYSMFQGIVPSVFWFLVLGPAGALAYALGVRYLERLPIESEEVTYLETAIYWAEWVPTRFTGLFFCFAGNFGPTFDYWLNHLFDTKESTQQHLLAMATLASHSDHTHDEGVLGFARFSQDYVLELKYLCERALFGWLGVAALFAILFG